MDRPTFPLIILLLVTVACSFTLRAQEADHDSYLEIYDNPTGRAEFELMRRADPATGRIPEGIRERELQYAATLPSREAIAAEAERKGASVAGTVTWRERGPVNQGGRTRAVAVDRENESVIIAGGVSGGIWRSDDLGQTWVRTTDIGAMHSVTCVAQDPRPGGGNVWYYGTGEYRANSANLSGDGIFKSTNGGRSWFSLESTATNTPESRDAMFDNVYRIVVDPSNLEQDEVYAACYGGIVRSTDGGTTWNAVLGDLDNRAPYTDVDIAPDGTLYATLSSTGRTVEGFWRSEDGVNWTDITPEGLSNSYGRISIGIAPSNPDVVYFFGQTSGAGMNGHSLWVYNHKPGGNGVWEDRSQALPQGIETYGSYCVVVRVKPDDEDMVFLAGIQCFRSTDGFRDTSNVGVFMGSGQHSDQHEYFFVPSDPSTMVAGHDGGISLTRSADSSVVRWESLNNGYATVQFYSVAIDHGTEGSNMVIGGTQDNGTWFVNNDDDLTDWRKIYGSDGGFCAIADGATDFYTSSQNGHFLRSQFDEEGTRITFTRIDPTGANDYLFINPMTLDKADDRIMFLPALSQLWRNNDLTGVPLIRSGETTSTNWEQLEIPSLASNEAISAVTTSLEAPAHRLYYGTSRGKLFRMDDAAGDAPTTVEIHPETFPRAYINSIWVNPRDGDELLVANSNYNVESLFHSTDAGATWEAVSGNLEQNPDGTGNGPSVSWINAVSVDGSTYYLAGTTAGLYSTEFLNGSNTVWKLEGASTIGNVVIDMIDVRESDGFVAVATHGRGIYTAHILDALVEADLSLSNQTVNFGKVKVGSAAYDTVVVGNSLSSQRDIQGNVPQPEGPFRVVSGAGPLALGPGATRELVLEFAPTEIGLVSEPIRLEHNASSTSTPSVIWLTGEGIGASGVEPIADSRNELRLQGAPNPFAKDVTISFELAEPTDVVLTVITPNGREIERLVESEMEAGRKEVAWMPGADVPNGAYYVRIRANGREQVVSVVLER